MIGRIAKVRKRDGRLVDFDESKIADAIHKAACAVGGGDRFLSEELAGVVTLFLEKQFTGKVPGIEEIQDMVERVLIETGHARMAKAYILYRERRARAREQVVVHAEPGRGPMVGNPTKALLSRWSKGRIADALAREADLDRKVADEVAARVEEKVFANGASRLTTTAIRSLVEAELFLMGYGDRVGRQALVGVPRYDVDRLLRGAKTSAWRARGPHELKGIVADAVLTQYALSEVYSSEVVDAHLDKRIHITDAGAPFEWLAALARVPRAGDPRERIEAAVALAHRLSQAVTRELTLVDLAGGGWSGEAGGALAAARHLLAHPALPRGGPLQIALALPLLDESGLTEALVREHWARFRSGAPAIEGLPRLVLHVAAGEVDREEGRRALLPALAAAAETGRIHFVLEREDKALVTPWYRVPADQLPDDAALGVAGSVALNLGALEGATEEALIEGLDAAIVLGLKTLRQKRSFMESLAADPAGPLYPIAAGARPLIAGEPGRGLDLVHLVGLGALAARLDQPRLAGRLRSYAAVRLAEESRPMRLRALLSPELAGEAARRFLDGGEPADREPYVRLDEPGVQATHDPDGGRLTLRFPREAAPAPEALFAALSAVATDARVGVVLLAPWPDRSVHASRKVAADL